MPDVKAERKELTQDIRELLDELEEIDTEHELLQWRQYFLSAHTTEALLTATTGFAERFKKEGVETLNEAMVEYMAEIEDAVLETEIPITEEEPVAERHSVLVD